MSRESDIIELIEEIVELKKQITYGWCPEFEYRLANELCEVGAGISYPKKFESCSDCREKYFEDMENFYLKKYKIGVDNLG